MSSGSDAIEVSSSGKEHGTMSSTYYGPVPISQVKRELGSIFDALADQRQVAISRHGRIVALIHPIAEVPDETLLAFMRDGDGSVPELTATHINQSSPGPAVRAAEGGRSFLVTKDGRVRGMMTGFDGNRRSSVAESLDREQAQKAYIAHHPEATADDLVRFTQTLDEASASVDGTQALVGVGASPPRLPVVPDPATRSLLRAITDAARASTRRVVDVLGPGLLAGPAEDAAIVDDIERKTASALRVAVAEALVDTVWVAPATDPPVLDRQQAVVALLSAGAVTEVATGVMSSERTTEPGPAVAGELGGRRRT
jgi:antitoxin (DNA-binding transcriptional repressor) of toxin-antitoxin stability system